MPETGALQDMTSLLPSRWRAVPPQNPVRYHRGPRALYRSTPRRRARQHLRRAARAAASVQREGFQHAYIHYLVFLQPIAHRVGWTRRLQPRAQGRAETSSTEREWAGLQGSGCDHRDWRQGDQPLSDGLGEDPDAASSASRCAFCAACSCASCCNNWLDLTFRRSSRSRAATSPLRASLLFLLPCSAWISLCSMLSIFAPVGTLD